MPELPQESVSLDTETITVVRDAFGLLAREHDHAAQLDAALRLVALEGRQKNIRVEQLLVTLKSLWEQLPEVRQAHWTAPHQQQLQHVITSFIDKYYSE
ncbi:MAG TPA: hypothetical protein VJ672_01020 [Gemmatimonadaceae bacterium]|nr:hypothetical protein [Gemmatimonadaceae bacterium]